MRLDVTGAHQHHQLVHLDHLVVHLEQVEFGDATSVEELPRGDWWIFSPSYYDTTHHDTAPLMRFSVCVLRVCGGVRRKRVGVTRARRWPDRRISVCFGAFVATATGQLAAGLEKEDCMSTRLLQQH